MPTTAAPTTFRPTYVPSAAPTSVPSESPVPSYAPSPAPSTEAPSGSPTYAPSPAPTTLYKPTGAPSSTPAPTRAPVRAEPTLAPTATSLTLVSIGDDFTCVAGSECDVVWKYTGDAARCEEVLFEIFQAGDKVDENTVDNTGSGVVKVPGDADVASYDVALSCADDDDVFAETATIAVAYPAASKSDDADADTTSSKSDDAGADAASGTLLVVVPVLIGVAVFGFGVCFIYEKQSKRAAAERAAGADHVKGAVEFTNIEVEEDDVAEVKALEAAPAAAKDADLEPTAVVDAPAEEPLMPDAADEEAPSAPAEEPLVPDDSEAPSAPPQNTTM